MLLLSPKELKDLLYEEMDIEIASFSEEYVYLEYAPMDLSPDIIFFNGKSYYITLDSLLHTIKKEIFSALPTVTYDKDGLPALFIIT